MYVEWVHIDPTVFERKSDSFCGMMLELNFLEQESKRRFPPARAGSRITHNTAWWGFILPFLFKLRGSQL